MTTRRQVLQAISLAALAPGGFAAPGEGPFGPLRRDSEGILDLPEAFRYRIISRAGEEMDDGLLVPPRADGMAAFDAGNGRVILVCNHENGPNEAGPFGPGNERLAKVDLSRVYDLGNGDTPGSGGTTTILYDSDSGEVLRRHLSLAGTEINCAGGKTPWGSWLSCEECFTNPGRGLAGIRLVRREKQHGYVFEVPADAEGLVDPVPLTAMGRFEHEAAAVDPRTGIVYLSEDRKRGLLYRFLPAVPGRLAEGGRLQALAIAGRPGFDTRNWDTPAPMPLREWLPVRWIDIDEPDPDSNDLRFTGHDAGAARFARGEGLVFADGSLFLAATTGGGFALGQVFEYRPGPGGDGGRVRLLAESGPGALLRHADNLTMAPWGDLVVCEDTVADCGLVGLTRDGLQYRMASNSHTSSELAGVCFAPDGRTLFVNIQDQGLTLAITGPWAGA